MIIDLTDQMSVESVKLYCKKENILRVGITSGCFDIFHYYHLIYLERCKHLCDVLIVGVDSDRSVKEIKGHQRPIINERHRLAIINSLKCVDACFILDNLNQFGTICETFIQKKEYGLVFRNQEWEDREDEVEIGRSNAHVIIVPDVEELSSTSETIKKIQKRKYEQHADYIKSDRNNE